MFLIASGVAAIWRVPLRPKMPSADDAFTQLSMFGTGVPRPQETPPPWDPAVARCLGIYGDLRGVVVSFERGASVYMPHVALPPKKRVDVPRRSAERCAPFWVWYYPDPFWNAGERLGCFL